ncbi:MAG: hypothetical protein ACI9U1_002049, partial [Porticoccaceae bacterium]
REELVESLADDGFECVEASSGIFINYEVNQMKKLNLNLSLSLLLLIVFNTNCFAQSTPSEMAEMSLQELFFEDTLDDASPWTLATHFKVMEFDGYLDGTQSLNNGEVLWDGPRGVEPRTAKNFPVVPTVITQKAVIFALGYKLSSQWQGSLLVPYIHQETDHISSVPGYSNFKIETSGIGDISAVAHYRWNSSYEGVWGFSFGVSLPTGSIDEEGDTPRPTADDKEQLPYTMQLGSGTYDFPFAINYQHDTGAHDINVGLSAKIRIGTNDRNYRLGNNYGLNGRYQFNLSPRLQPFIGLDFEYSEKIHGQDDSLIIPGLPVSPYPASITNPELFGGKKINLGLGLLWSVVKNFKLKLEIGLPVYQNLNGPQPKENWQTTISISGSL